MPVYIIEDNNGHDPPTGLYEYENSHQFWKLALLTVWKLILIDAIKHVIYQWKTTPVWRLDFYG